MRRLSKAEFSIMLLLLTLAASVMALVSQSQRARTDVIERAFSSAEDLVSLVVTANRHYIDSISGIPIGELTPEPDIETEKAWLPATFATRYTQSYSDQNPDADFRIYSRDPFSFQADRVLDRFAEDALDVLLAGEIRKYREVEDVGDGFVRVRLARAFEMDANCIACHNRPEWGLQKQDWEIGDVRGAWEASIVVPPTVLHARAEITGLFALIALALGLGAFVVFPAVRREVKDREFFHDRSVSMEKSADAYRESALQDPLTKIGNRRAYDLELAEIMRVHGESGKNAALILLDIDHFKRVNDTYGHDVGDEVIQTVAHVLKNEVRGADKVARIGGEEFSILTTNADHASVHSLATRIKERVAAHVFNSPTGDLSVTISAGGSFLGENGTDATLYKSADELLYHAKSTGRNKVCVADE